ncbi:hypothetical protein ACM2L1_12520 [Escherichia coli]
MLRNRARRLDYKIMS